MRVLKPDTEADIRDAIVDANRSGAALAIEGNGTKVGFGRKVETQSILKLSGLSGITMYEPDEMVFTARAGTSLAEIEATLDANGQCLAFEPGDLAPLWGAPQGRATIGGIVAAGIAGPRRFAAGAARDHLLGFTAVNGKGERFKAGGRVVKNVTGYDLPKLAAGSFGTLFVMTEVTLRALPRGASAVLAIEGLEPAAGLRVLREVASSPFEPTGLAYVPGATSQTLIRLEGQSEGVAARAEHLMRGAARGATRLEEAEGQAAFRKLTNVAAQFEGTSPLWRISIPATRAIDALADLTPTNWFADWAGGHLWLTPSEDANPHAVARDLGGHATCMRGGDDVFPPLDEPIAALTKELKNAFDPARVLNPGRMYDGI